MGDNKLFFLLLLFGRTSLLKTIMSQQKKEATFAKTGENLGIEIQVLLSKSPHFTQYQPTKETVTLI